jgi:hypothetical protein
MARPEITGKGTPLADDVIWGVDGEDGIAAFLGLSPRRTYYLIGTKKIPTKKIGHRTIVASRAELRRLFSGGGDA